MNKMKNLFLSILLIVSLIFTISCIKEEKEYNTEVVFEDISIESDKTVEIEPQDTNMVSKPKEEEYVDEEENVSTQSASESSKDSTDNSMNKPANTHTPDVSEEVTEDNSFEDLEDDENGMGWVG